MADLELLIDSEIVGAANGFSSLGSVKTFDGRALSAEQLGSADVLLVRSVSKVDRALLKNSRVRFVGTATSGVDHIDAFDLEEDGITVCSAAGCNARAVAEHVICCAFLYADRIGRAVSSLSLGVLGFGHVGKALTDLASGLFREVVIRDPLKSAADLTLPCASMEELLSQDIVSLHVPLTKDGEHPTFHLIDEKALGRMHESALLINAARGGVIDERCIDGQSGAVNSLWLAIDCWEDEPEVRTNTLSRSWLATPHIAGHSLEARARASEMMFQSVRQWAGLESVGAKGFAPADAGKSMLAAVTRIEDALASVYDLGGHTQRLKVFPQIAAASRPAYFYDCRKLWGLRREFSHYALDWEPGVKDFSVGRRLGFSDGKVRGRVGWT